MLWPTRIVLQSSDRAIGRHWSFNAAAAEIVVTYDIDRPHGSACRRDGTLLFESADPFELLEWMASFDLSGAGGGARWVGYIGYEFNRAVEPLPPRPVDPGASLPAFCFWLATPRPEPLATARLSRTSDARIVARSMSRDAYLAAAARSIEYIAAGDVFQINLTHRLAVATTLAADEVWGRLTATTPATYGVLIELDEAAIISNSPELFFRVARQADGRRRIVNRPIKGTRPAGPGMRQALERSPKDRAELAMIVDLQRNDLGRVCEIGSVRVTEPRVIEEHPTVLHGVATVEGTLREDASFPDIVRALFPCGSITGCPKIRAMQLIGELEPVARGPYCGAIGYLDARGDMMFNVAIRTMTLADGVAHVSVGGGIVADSDPGDEYRETLVKARAMLAAVGMSDEEIAALEREA